MRRTYDEFFNVSKACFGCLVLLIIMVKVILKRMIRWWHAVWGDSFGNSFGNTKPRYPVNEKIRRTEGERKDSSFWYSERVPWGLWQLLVAPPCSGYNRIGHLAFRIFPHVFPAVSPELSYNFPISPFQGTTLKIESLGTLYEREPC